MGRVEVGVRIGMGWGWGGGEGRWGAGKPDGDGGAEVGFGSEVELAAVEADTAADDGEAEAGAGEVLDVGSAAEGFEQVGEVLGRDAEAAVAHGELDMVGGDFEGQVHRAALGGVFGGVGEQVIEDGSEEAFVEKDGSRVDWGRGRDMDVNVDGAALIGGGQGFIGDAVAEGREVEGLRGTGEAAFLDASEEEDLFHEPGHAAGVFADGGEVFAAFLGLETVEVAIEEAGGGGDDAERGAEFVGDHGHEALAELTELAFAFEGMEEFGFGAFALDGEGDLFGDEGEDLLGLGAVGLGVVVILDHHGADDLAVEAEGDTEPHGGGCAHFAVPGVAGGFVESGGCGTEHFVAGGAEESAGAQDEGGHAAAEATGWGWWIHVIPPIDSVVEAGFAVAEDEVEIPGWHEAGDDFVDTGVEVVEVGGLVDGFGDEPDGLEGGFAALAFGDFAVEGSVGIGEFAGSVEDPFLEVGIEVADGLVGDATFADIGDDAVHPGDAGGIGIAMGAGADEAPEGGAIGAAEFDFLLAEAAVAMEQVEEPGAVGGSRVEVFAGEGVQGVEGGITEEFEVGIIDEAESSVGGGAIDAFADIASDGIEELLAFADGVFGLAAFGLIVVEADHLAEGALVIHHGEEDGADPADLGAGGALDHVGDGRHLNDIPGEGGVEMIGESGGGELGILEDVKLGGLFGGEAEQAAPGGVHLEGAAFGREDLQALGRLLEEHGPAMGIGRAAGRRIGVGRNHGERVAGSGSTGIPKSVGGRVPPSGHIGWEGGGVRTCGDMSDTTLFFRSPFSAGQWLSGRQQAEQPTVETPVIRIPVIPANRERLRKLRARELEVWGAEATEAEERPGYLNPPPDREAGWVLLLLGGVAAGALLQSSTMLLVVVEHWERFRILVQSLVG